MAVLFQRGWGGCVLATTARRGVTAPAKPSSPPPSTTSPPHSAPPA